MEFEAVQQMPPHQGGGQRVFRVDLNNRTCDCGSFQMLRFPCTHALAACADQRLDWGAYTSDLYTVHRLTQIYCHRFPPIGDETDWPTYRGDLLVADPKLRRNDTGRPLNTRIRTEMDMVEPGQPRRCGLCRSVGHFRNQCPHREIVFRD